MTPLNQNESPVVLFDISSGGGHQGLRNSGI